MTNLYHTPIAFAAPLNSSVVNTPLGQLDMAIDDLNTRTTTLEGYPSGDTAFEQINFGPPGTTLLIASGAITITRSRHRIDTEGLAGTDNLTTINGFEDGDILRLQTVSASRVVTVVHDNGVGGIYLADLSDRVLDDPHYVLELMYDEDNLRWVEQVTSLSIPFITELDSTTQRIRQLVLPLNSFVVGSNNQVRLDFAPKLSRRNYWSIRAAAATFSTSGIAADTAVGAGGLTEANDTRSTFVSVAIAATAGTFGGRRTTTFDLTRTGYDPVFEAVIKTGADITNMRIFVGLTNQAVTNVDDHAGAGTIAVAFVYSTVRGDAGWIGLCSDGATQTISSSLAAIAAATVYHLRIRVDSTSSIAYFSIDDGAEVAISTTLPATTTEMGAEAIAIKTATTAPATNFAISRLVMEFD
jgi:hypothetical protein